MDDRLVWFDGLLLPITQRRRFVESRLRGEAPDQELRDKLEEHGDEARRRKWAAELRERCRASDARVLVPSDPAYPRRCLQLHDPPAVLFARGKVGALRVSSAVSVVGARRGSERGRLCAERMGGELARAGVPVVSGLAYGVDGRAHRGCVRAGGIPIGVLGTGLDRVYPSGHAELQEDVARHGCLLSEYPPGTGPRAHHFLARNRLIAALGVALVVVEAGEKSGTLSTVDFALQLGREVMAVPGPVDAPEVSVCLALLREGAIPVRNAADVLHDLGLEPGAETEAAPLGLGLSPQSPIEIARRLDWSLERVMSTLSDLELDGLVRRVPGGRYAAAPVLNLAPGAGG